MRASWSARFLTSCGSDGRTVMGRRRGGAKGSGTAYEADDFMQISPLASPKKVGGHPARCASPLSDKQRYPRAGGSQTAIQLTLEARGMPVLASRSPDWNVFIPLLGVLMLRVCVRRGVTQR